MFTGPNIVTDGLVLHLDAANTKSYPGSGTTWFDKSGRGNNGTLTNGPTFSSGNGGSIVFDGTNDYALFSYMQPVYDSTVSFTWNIWVYPTVNAVSQVLMGNRGGDLVFTKLTTSGFEYYPSGIGVSMPLNIWQNVCIVKNLTNFYYYRNSALISSFTSAITKVAKPFYIGGDPVGEFSNSKIALAQIYNRALSASEILQNYNATKTRFGL
jgi:hypothetical protein